MLMRGNGVYIKLIDCSDAEALLTLQLRNREFFQTYTPLRDHDFFTLKTQTNLIQSWLEQCELDQLYAFGIYLLDSDELIGKVTLSEVLRGPLQSCSIGYFLDQSYNGKGYMTEAVRLVVTYAFRALCIHRIEAGVMPQNLASIKVLEKAGFQKEGIARKSVKINGKWEDHQVLAIVDEEEE